MLSTRTVGLPWTRSRIESAAATTAAGVNQGIIDNPFECRDRFMLHSLQRIKDIHTELSHEIINLSFEPGLPRQICDSRVAFTQLKCDRVHGLASREQIRCILVPRPLNTQFPVRRQCDRGTNNIVRIFTRVTITTTTWTSASMFRCRRCWVNGRLAHRSGVNHGALVFATSFPKVSRTPHLPRPFPLAFWGRGATEGYQACLCLLCRLDSRQRYEK